MIMWAIIPEDRERRKPETRGNESHFVKSTTAPIGLIFEHSQTCIHETTAAARIFETALIVRERGQQFEDQAEAVRVLSRLIEQRAWVQ
jgi:hypothetical protein